MDKGYDHRKTFRAFCVALLGLCGVVSAFTAGAASFRDRIEYGNALLNSGDFEGAREVYRNLQIEHPENEIVYYSLGCANYEEGESVSALQDPQGAIELFASARDAFHQAMTNSDSMLRTDAAYNHANTLAQIAKQKASLGDQEATLAAFEEALQAYEEVLARYPDHEKARHNLNHMRYLLKRMLQNPPQENDQSKGEQGEKQQDQQQQQDQGQQEQQSQKEQSEQDQKEQEQAEDEQEQQQEDNEQKQPQDQQQQQQGQEQQQAAASASDEEMTEDDMDIEDRQTIEAILQSLEAQDKREQEDLRTSTPGSGIRREWW